MELIKQIGSIPLFQGLARKQQEDLSMIVVDQVIPRNKIVFSQEDEAAGFYVVISGRMKVFKLSPEGKEQILHIFGAGEPVGEVAVFTGNKFPAYAATLEESRVFFFPRPAFVDLIGKNPSLALNMLGVLSKRLRKFAGLIEDLSLKEVPGRLAAYLLLFGGQQKDACDFTLDVSKTQLSSLLGTIPETLSRILAKMEREKLIKSEGKRIAILDRKGLEELSLGERKLL